MNEMYSYEIQHNKETNDFNGDNAHQFILTLGSEAEAGELKQMLEEILEKYLTKRDPHPEELEGVPQVYCGDCLVPIDSCAHKYEYEREGKR